MNNLLRPPSPALAGELAGAVRAIGAAMPLGSAHTRELPYAVRDLSRMLTLERASLQTSYWINKRLLTAYCRYFLPWNLLRLSWLLPNLGLALKPGDTVLDLGSGPLTLPLALWAAFPAWRAMPLTFVCGDVAPAPLEAGRAIFRQLAGQSPWRIELRRGPLNKLLHTFSGKAALIGACNVLNELRPARDVSLEDRLGELAGLVASRLEPEGRFLAVEPGTRLGGRLMALLRRSAFAERLVPEAPCTHKGRCPMLEERANSWCHCTHNADAAPAELVRLTRAAKLPKTGLSLSCLLLRPATEAEWAGATAFVPAFADGDADDMDDEAITRASRAAWEGAFAAACDRDGGGRFVRILSDPIRLPGEGEAARYGCSHRGLVLVHNALRIPSGAALEVSWPYRDERDAKSGALVVAPSSAPRPAPAQAAPAQAAPVQAQPPAARPRPARPPRPFANHPRGGRPAKGRPAKPGPHTN